MNVGMQCVPCFREGNIAQPGQRLSTNPPFALAILNGESVCLNHLHELAGQENRIVHHVDLRLTPAEQIELAELRRKQRRWFR